MVTVFDGTVQHSGWSNPTFPDAGWGDYLAPLVTGVAAGSFYVESLNRQPTDVGLSLLEGDGTPPTGFMFNQHISGSAQGTASPANYPVGPNTRLYVYTRVPQPSNQILVRVTMSDSGVTPPPTTPPCQYGTRPQPGFESAIVVTPELVDAVLAARGMQWLRVALAPILYTVFNPGNVCTSPPPPFPNMTSENWVDNLLMVKQAWEAVAWPYFCQCVPGTPTPVPYPPPAVTAPPGFPVAPTFPCDPADLCSTISLIWQEVAGLRSSMASVYELVTLLQRYGMPFEYIPGAVHMGFEGEGSVQIPRSVGVHVRITSPPPGLVLDSNPDYWWDQGWMSISNATGVLDQKRIAKRDQLWFPPSMPQATIFNWALKPGVVIDVRELYAEP